MSKLLIIIAAAGVLAGCGPSREKVLASFDSTPVVGRPDTIVVKRSPPGAGSPRSTEAAMLLSGARALSAAGFKRFVVVKTGVLESDPAVWGYVLKGFKQPYEPPRAAYASHGSDVMVVRGLRVYEPSYHGSVDIEVITRQLAADPLFP